MKTFREIKREIRERGILIIDAKATIGKKRIKAYRIVGSDCVNERYLASANEIIMMYYNGEIGA